MKRFVFTLLIVACICQTAPSMALTLKIATLSPEGSMWMTKMRQGADSIEKQTDNRIQFKFYPGGIMGNDTAVLQKMRIGQLHGGAIVAGSFTNHFPGNQIYSQMMVFKSLDEVAYVRNQMDDYIVDGLEKAGFSVFGLAGGGFAYLMSTEPIMNIEDLRNQKLWIPDDNEFTQEMVKSFGITPIPLALADVRTGLQTGLINAVATSPSGAIILQWHTQIKYLVDVPFLYLYATFSLSKNAISNMSSPDRDIVKQVMGKIFREIEEQNNKDNIEALETLKARGIKFLTPSAEELSHWQEKSRDSSTILVEKGFLPKEPVQEMNRLIQDYHSQKK